VGGLQRICNIGTTAFTKGRSSGSDSASQLNRKVPREKEEWDNARVRNGTYKGKKARHTARPFASWETSRSAVQLNKRQEPEDNKLVVV
jgi:hypothetical protein